MNNWLSSSGPRLLGRAPLAQLLVSVVLVFLLAFGADVLLQTTVGLFLAGIVEQDAFFYSAVRQQDASAQSILALIKQISFLALAVGFVVTLVFLLLFLYRRFRLRQPFQPEPKRLLKATLLSLRGIVTVTFIFLVITAIYELLLRIVGNQPPFFLLAALIVASMYVLTLAYALFDYARGLGEIYR